MLTLTDSWVWDSWPVGDRHLFFLQAPRSLGDPDARHANATVGHAVTTDWVHWKVLPDVLRPSSQSAWDDLAIWTGSVVPGDTGRWHFFYTATSRRDGLAVQRIGRADSDDLITWTRAGDGPVVVADPRWYQTAGETPWRDPWVLRDPGGDGWHMLITARTPSGDGVIGHARSADLSAWEVLPPLSEPAGFGHLEVTQASLVDGRPMLTFSCAATDLSDDRRRQTPVTGMWSAPGPSLLGPWDLTAARPFDDPTLYAGHVIDTDAGPALLAFIDHRDGAFIGSISDPVAVSAGPDGTLMSKV